MKIKVGVFFGGRSVEHEISVISAMQTMLALDEAGYEVLPIYISKTGAFYTGDGLREVENYKDQKQLIANAQQLAITPMHEGFQFLHLQEGFFKKSTKYQIDVAFPVLHGTFGEDGGLQGMLELMDIPYVGCNVLASSTGMDKVVMKMILREAGLPVIDYTWFYSKDYFKKPAPLLDKMIEDLGFPLIVKPADLGSSVGISQAHNRAQLEDAIDHASQFAAKILVEKMISQLREINCSVLGTAQDCQPSACEEPVRSGEFLTYKDKYVSDGSGSKGMRTAKRILPAQLPDAMTKLIQNMSVETFKTLGCAGVSRIDMMIDESNNQVYVNEINTIPGSLSFYLWEATNKTFPALVTDLVNIATKVHRDKNDVNLSFDDFNIFNSQGKAGKK